MLCETKREERKKGKLGNLCGTAAVAVRDAKAKRKTLQMKYGATLKRTVRLEVWSHQGKGLEMETNAKQREERLVVLLEACY